MAVDNHFRLMTALEAEEELGKKYFYRQRTYRYNESGVLKAFKFRSRQCFLPHMLIAAYLEDLKEKLTSRFPHIEGYQVLYDETTRRVVIDGVFGRYIHADTDAETEEDLLVKFKNIVEWMAAQPPATKVDNNEVVAEFDGETSKQVDGMTGLSTVEESPFPTDIKYMRVTAPDVAGVEVKSFILISLPSVADFIGVRSDNFSRWVQQGGFNGFVVSAYPKQIQDTQNRVPWIKGSAKGAVSFMPLELIPEILIALRHSSISPSFPARAEQLYQLASSTLEAVGLAISGDKSKAAAELARVSEGLGITAADQVIEIFKRYESRPFQVETTRKFAAKVLAQEKDLPKITGEITIGVTGMYPNAWLAKGTTKKLPAKQRTSGREVMRTLDPGASVGMTFSESHYIKDSSNMEEVIKTGKQGKSFYDRLKSVGLLDDDPPEKIVKAV